MALPWPRQLYVLRAGGERGCEWKERVSHWGWGWGEVDGERERPVRQACLGLPDCGWSCVQLWAKSDVTGGYIHLPTVLSQQQRWLLTAKHFLHAWRHARSFTLTVPLNESTSGLREAVGAPRVWGTDEGCGVDTEAKSEEETRP